MRILMMVGAVLALVLASSARGDDDRAKIQGTWEVVSALAGGGEPPGMDLLKRSHFVFGEKEVTTKRDGESWTNPYTLDPSTTPAVIDFGPERESGQMLPSIYELDGDSLKICMTSPGADRPTSFASEEGDRTLLLLLRRVKP